MDKSSAAYKRAKAEADSRYGLGTSAYKSGHIVQLYKRYGGRFKGKKPTQSRGLKKWYQGEKWIQVVPYLTRGTIIQCGARSDRTTGKACRPLRRQNTSTPITIQELLKIHRRSEIVKAAIYKEKHPTARLNWRSLSFA